ncbi:MAG: choice-of-anchor X domain-containing protein, partial [Spirochaetota bacterium]|nr:choice-of-anchor X domain-containing protein [Spirochaetota bacterium]
SAEYYARDPKLGPRVLEVTVTPDDIPPDGATEVLFTARITDPDDNVTSVVIDLSTVGGDPGQAMYDDGSHGDVTPGDKIYSYETLLIDETGHWTITVTATDEDSQTGSGDIEVMTVNSGWSVIDDNEADFVGYWAGGGESTGYNNSYITYHESGDGSSIAKFTPAIMQSGNYNVYAWWTSHNNRGNDVPFTIKHSGGSDTISVNQRVNGSKFMLLGTYYFVSQPAYEPIIVDNEDALVIGDWPTSSGNTYEYGKDILYHESGFGLNTVTFTPNLPESGNYDIYAWWTTHSNRATDVPYTINYSGGSDVVVMNQERGGGAWIYLGTYYFNAGTGGSVMISDDANEYIIADAVKWQLSSQKQCVEISDDANGYIITDVIMWEPQN